LTRPEATVGTLYARNRLNIVCSFTQTRNYNEY